MKKSNFLIIGMMLMGMGLLSGCQSTHDSNQVNELALSQDKRMGIIQSLGGAHVSSQATHLLRLDDGKTLFLKSALLDLDNTKYTGKEVEVGGNILRTTDGNDVMDVLNIDLIDREINVTQDAPQWVDYSSDNFQIGMKYRDDYKLQENSNNLTLTKIEKPVAIVGDATVDKPATTVNTNVSNGSVSGAPVPVSAEKKEATITIQVISRDANYNLLEAMGVPSDSSSDLLAKGYNKSKITQKALDAYKQAKSDESEIDYFIKSGYSYQLKFTAGDSATLVTDQNMFYDVLASISFGANLGNSGNAATPASTSAVTPDNKTKADIPANVPTISALDGFESFSSEAMKFSIKYPKGYYFGNTASQTPSAVRSYAFSTKPADDKSGELIVLDIIKGTVPGGNQIDLGNGKKGVVTKSGNSVTVVVDWSNGQYFQLKGPSDLQTIMQQMASSIVI